VLDPFTYAFAQRGLLEVLLLSAGAGVLGTWIVVRGLAFYSHAVAAAAFPGLVLAAGVGLAPLTGALGAAAAVALGVGGFSSRRRAGNDALTALALVGALALGVILASDVFHSGSEVDTLLFGSLFAISGTDLALAAVGALLATALLVVPAVTTRLVTRRVLAWQLATVALTAAEGVAGVWLSVQTNAPPGATIATVGGVVFAVTALVTENRSRYCRRHDDTSIARPRRSGARRRPAGVRG